MNSKNGGTAKNRTWNSCLGNNRYIHLTTAPDFVQLGESALDGNTPKTFLKYQSEPFDRGD